MLLLNSVLDRETPEYTALNFVEAIRATCSASYGEVGTEQSGWEASDLITHVVYIEGSSVIVDIEKLKVRARQMILSRPAAGGPSLT